PTRRSPALAPRSLHPRFLVVAAHQHRAQGDMRLKFDIDFTDALEFQRAIKPLCVKARVAFEGHYSRCASSTFTEAEDGAPDAMSCPIRMHCEVPDVPNSRLDGSSSRLFQRPATAADQQTRRQFG